MHLQPYRLAQSHFDIVNGVRVIRYSWSSARKRQYQEQWRKIKPQPHGINSLNVTWDAIRQGDGLFMRDHPNRAKEEESQAWWE